MQRKMNVSALKEQIAYTVIDVLLCLKPQDKAREQVFQILLERGKYDIPTARCMIKDMLRIGGHKVDHERIQSCIDTVHDLTCGFADWVRMQQSEVFGCRFPILELIKILDMEESVNWIERWQNCGGKIYSGSRMMSSVGDPIWVKISDFGLPFPPFALNSGMGWRHVPRDKAIVLGVVDPDETPDEQSTAYLQSLKLDPKEFDKEFFERLKKEVDSLDPRLIKIEIVKDELPHKKLPAPHDEQTD